MTASLLNIRHLEELSLGAWPALQTLHYDGWVLRLSHGFTRRANSVNPLYESTLPLEEKIAWCEELYARHRLRTVFKLTDAAQPSGLDTKLEARGYVRDAETSVQSVSLEGYEAQSSDEISTALNEAWMAHFFRLNEDNVDKVPIVYAMLGSLATPAAFAALRHEGEVVAVGLAVLERGHVGISGIVVDARIRGQGVGTRLMGALMAWGKVNGAHTAYLNVMSNNAPALHLYSRLGFVEQYRYWYRIGIL